MEWSDLRDARPKRTPTRRLWKCAKEGVDGELGDNPNGWQICMDIRRTKDNVGQLMPIIINFPTAKRFAQFFTMTRTDEFIDEETGEKVVETFDDNVPVWKAKGFVPAHEARDIKPTRRVIDTILERVANELQLELASQKVDPATRRKEIAELRALVLKANGVTAKAEGKKAEPKPKPARRARASK